nr:SusC/RagA family TonB-linked outer membrane protein [Chitinophagaceae bacterium]
MNFYASGAISRVLTKTIASRNCLFLMKLSCLFIPSFLLCANLLIAGTGSAQKIREVKVTIGLAGEPLRSALAQVESQTTYKFAFVESQISAYDRLYLPKQTRSLPETLSLLLANTNLTYTVKKSIIAIFQNERPAAIPGQVETTVVGKDIATIFLPVRGRVTDEKNTPLGGVSVVVKGTNTGVTTDALGNFSINIVDGSARLIISNVGFQTQEVPVSDRSSLNIILVAGDGKLEDVVVIGYGTSRKKDVTGSVTSVNVKKIDEVPLPSIDQLLSGRAGGVQINQASGQAGAGTSIRIRGGNSLNGTNEPLFVVDGFPIINDNDAYSPSGPLGLSNSGAGNPRQGNSTGALNWLNPADIESMEVLKDASATAIYGSRGANGVIIITTKRGKAGQARINLTSSAGFSTLNDNKIELMNGSQYAAYSNLYNAEKNITTPTPVWYKDTTVDGKLFPTPDKIGEGTNWLKQVTRTGLAQNYSVGFSGGKDVLYAGSVSMLDQQTPILGSRYKRGSFRLNMQSQLTDWLSFDNSFALSLSTIDNSPSDVRDVQKFGAFEAALAANPAEPAYNADGSLNYSGGIVDNATKPGIKYSPIALATDVLNRNSIQTVVDNLSFKAHIVRGVNFEVRGSLFSNDALRDIYYNSKTTFNGFMVNGLGGKNTNNSKSYLIENFATVNKTFGRNVFNSVLGYSYQKTEYRSINIGASGFPNDNLKNENLAAGSTQYPTQTNRIEDLLSSYYVRLNNIISDKYLFTFTGRLDGSSKFGAGNKWAFFPSGAFSWKIKEEDFMKTVTSFSDLKLRISYGLTGNQAIQSLQSKFLLGVNNYPINGVLQTGVYPSVLGNPKLKWETTRQFNLGLDFGFINQRVTGSLNYYVKNTDNLLQQKVIPTNSGYSTIFDNIGSISNKGIELELHGTVIKSGKFSWDIDANIAHNKQKLTDLGLPKVDTLLVGFQPVGGTSAYVSLIKGQPVGLFYGYRNKGVYTDQSDLDKDPHLPGAKVGSRKIRDLDGDGQITDK